MPGRRPGRRPTGPERRGVGKVQVADLINGHAVEDRRGGDVDPLGDLGVAVAEKLDAEQPAGPAVARHVGNRAGEPPNLVFERHKFREDVVRVAWLKRP
jgi:hypothetical protein